MDERHRTRPISSPLQDLRTSVGLPLLDAAAAGARIDRRATDASIETAVAAVLRDAGGRLDLLLILRADRADDTWSGHVALPGGRASSSDSTLVDTAARETHEEVGLSLTEPDALLAGALPLVTPRILRTPRVSIRPFVWVTAGTVGDHELTLKRDEVAAALWIPLDELTHPSRRQVHRVPGAGGDYHEVDSVDVGLEAPLWGLTLRIVDDLAARLATT